jgi:hypothetical protein
MDVPQGTIAEVLAWVGDDRERAQAALDAEYEGAIRSTLIAQLEAIADTEEVDMSDEPAVEAEEGVFISVEGDTAGVKVTIEDSEFELDRHTAVRLYQALNQAVVGLAL